MRGLKNLMILIGVCAVCLVCMVPLILNHGLWHGQEIWLLEVIRELHGGFSLVPELNGQILSDQNPVNIILLSLIPGDNILFFRFVAILLGLIVVGSVFIFCLVLWNVWTALWSSLFTATSYGFLITYSSLNVSAIPCTCSIVALMMFFAAYLKGVRPVWYIPSYIMVCLATITGGWTMLAFVVFSVIFLILIDLAPGRFFDIMPITGVFILCVILLGFYLVYRIAGGSSFVSGALSHGPDMGFFKSSWALIKFGLPWFPLVIPAWAYEIKPDEDMAWKKLLPSKIALVVSLAILWFSQHCEPGYAVLAVPFIGILIGYWVATGLKGVSRILKFKRWAVISAGLIILVAGVIAIICTDTDSSLYIKQGIAIGVLGSIAICLAWLIHRNRLALAVFLEVLSVIVVCWTYSFIMLPARDVVYNPEQYIKEISDLPLLVFEDDMYMRGYLGYVGASPAIVSRDVVPFGNSFYLAVSTKDINNLIKELTGRMDIEVKSSFKSNRVYALLAATSKIKPGPGL